MVCKTLNAEFFGKDVQFTGVSIDSRTINNNNLFFAIVGENNDGHIFVEDAIKNGAAAIIVNRRLDIKIPQLIVKDTRIALGELARDYRAQFKQPIIALTGSCGKTTTKMLITQILKTLGSVNTTVGNLNNDYGVPLTLLSMDLQAKFAVIEMGANHPKEIAYLTHIVQPDVAMITNAGPVHLEGFKSIQGVAESKGEIYQGLNANGIALINLDDKFSDYWISINVGTRYLTFGFNPSADIYISNIQTLTENQSQFKLHTLQGECEIQFNLLGEHNIRNALAAACAGIALNIPLEKIKRGLESAVAVDKRFVEKITKDGGKIIDDTYNANPLAMEMALKFLSQKSGERLLIVGDMGELGDESIYYHQELGRQAKEYGINKLYAIGEFTQHTVKSFGEQGFHFIDHNAMLKALEQQVNKNTTVLVKGSRSARMERIVDALLA